ncbi:MAG: hypothetical protein FJX76_05015 [Armatimonadetes bacterium]|nr:hypothetical protein [Armatimonadota bacterium]
MNVLSAVTPTPPPADVDRQLAQVQAEIKGFEDRVELLETHRKAGQRECARHTERCNEIYHKMQPLYTEEARLIKLNDISRYSGLASGGMLGLGPGLLTFAPVVALCVTGATLTVLGAAFLGTEYTRRKLREMRPEINSLSQDWKYYEQQLRREERDVASDSAQIRSLEPQIKAARGREEVLLVARGINSLPTPDASVKTEDDAVVIGQLRVPRRSPKADQVK